MKITTIVNTPVPQPLPPPTVEEITLHLTPREAILLAAFIGSTSVGGRYNVLQDTNFNFVPTSLLKEVSYDECDNLGEIYHSIKKEFQNLARNGIKIFP